MPQNQTKQLAHGAMMVAIFTVLLAVSFYVPLVSIVTSLFVTLPIAWYSAKYNLSSSIFVAIVGTIISFFIGGLLILPFAIPFAVMGIVMGEAIRTKKSKVYLLLSTGLTFLITTAIEYIITVQFFNMDPIKDVLFKMLDQVKESYLEMVELSTRLTGKSPITVEQVNQMFHTVELTIPAAIIVSAFTSSLIIIVVNLPILKRLGLDVPKFAPFRDMKLPRSVLWYYLLVLVVTLFMKPTEGTFVYVAFINASFILMILLLLQGISLIQYYVHEQGWPKWVTVVATLLAIPLQSFVVLLGIVDLGFDIRSLVRGKSRK